MKQEGEKKKIWQFKYDSVYLLNDVKYILQYQILENVMNDDNKMDQNVDKVMLLTTESLEKDKMIEIIIRVLIK